MPQPIFDRPSPAIPIAEKDTLRLTFFGIQGTNRLVKVALLQSDLQGNMINSAHQFAPSRDGNEDTHTIELTQGYLHAISVNAFNGTVVQGELFCQIGIVSGGLYDDFFKALLISDYLSSGAALGWPYSTLKTMASGPGHVEFDSKSAPSAGSDFDYSFSPNRRRHIHSFLTKLTTDANVANRRVHLTLEFNNNIFLDVPASAVQAASTTRTYVFANGVQNAEVDGVILTAIPADIRMQQDVTIVTSTTNIQAGDQFTDMETFFTQWAEEQL